MLAVAAIAIGGVAYWSGIGGIGDIGQTGRPLEGDKSFLYQGTCRGQVEGELGGFHFDTRSAASEDFSGELVDSGKSIKIGGVTLKKSIF